MKLKTESLLIAAQNDAIRIYFIKVKIVKTQKDNKCRLYSYREEMVNPINECSRLTQKEYKSKHDWVEKVIHGEWCKKFKYDHAKKGNLS